MAKKNKENAPLIENEGVEENVIPTPAPNEEKEETPSEEPAQAKPRGRAKAEAEHEPEVVHEHTPEVVHEHTPEAHDEVSNLEIFREYPGVFMPARANANTQVLTSSFPYSQTTTLKSSEKTTRICQRLSSQKVVSLLRMSRHRR